MKFPFFKKRKKAIAKPLKSGSIQDIRASAFFLDTLAKEKDELFDVVLEEVNREQKEIVEEFGRAN